MRMKTCARCGETKPLDEFPPVRRSEPEKLQRWCRACFSEANRENYWRNPERERARVLLLKTRKREENRRRTIEYLFAHPCVGCGEKDIVVLQFDHLRDKKFNISTMIANGSSWERIEGRLYAATGMHFLFNAQTGEFLGTRKINRTIELAQDGQSFSLIGRATTFDPGGNVLATLMVRA